MWHRKGSEQSDGRALVFDIASFVWNLLAPSGGHLREGADCFGLLPVQYRRLEFSLARIGSNERSAGYWWIELCQGVVPWVLDVPLNFSKLRRSS